MKIKQFEDKGLAHYSYAILSECQKEVVLIDPARNPQPYYDYAQEHCLSLLQRKILWKSHLDNE